MCVAPARAYQVACVAPTRAYQVACVAPARAYQVACVAPVRAYQVACVTRGVETRHVPCTYGAFHGSVPHTLEWLPLVDLQADWVSHSSLRPPACPPCVLLEGGGGQHQTVQSPHPAPLPTHPPVAVVGGT